jgi:hypothetical protein
LAALGAVFGRGAGSSGKRHRIVCSCLGAPIGAQGGDGAEELQAVTDCGDAKLLQGFVRQVRKDRLVDLILAEGRLVPFESQVPQPSSKVHDSRAPKTPHKASSFRSKGLSRAKVKRREPQLISTEYQAPHQQHVCLGPHRGPKSDIA